MLVYIANGNIVTGEGLRNDLSGNYVNDAVVTAQLKESDDDDADDVGDAVTLVYVEGSDGEYRGLLDGSDLQRSDSLVLQVDAVADGLPAFRVRPRVRAVPRRS